MTWIFSHTWLWYSLLSLLTYISMTKCKLDSFLRRHESSHIHIYDWMQIRYFLCSLLLCNSFISLTLTQVRLQFTPSMLTFTVWIGGNIQFNTFNGDVWVQHAREHCVLKSWPWCMTFFKLPDPEIICSYPSKWSDLQRVSDSSLYHLRFVDIGWCLIHVLTPRTDWMPSPSSS